MRLARVLGLFATWLMTVCVVAGTAFWAIDTAGQRIGVVTQSQVGDPLPDVGAAAAGPGTAGSPEGGQVPAGAGRRTVRATVAPGGGPAGAPPLAAVDSAGLPSDGVPGVQAPGVQVPGGQTPGVQVPGGQASGGQGSGGQGSGAGPTGGGPVAGGVAPAPGATGAPGPVTPSGPGAAATSSSSGRAGSPSAGRPTGAPTPKGATGPAAPSSTGPAGRSSARTPGQTPGATSGQPSAQSSGSSSGRPSGGSSAQAAGQPAGDAAGPSTGAGRNTKRVVSASFTDPGGQVQLACSASGIVDWRVLPAVGWTARAVIFGSVEMWVSLARGGNGVVVVARCDEGVPTFERPREGIARILSGDSVRDGTSDRRPDGDRGRTGDRDGDRGRTGYRDGDRDGRRDGDRDSR